MATKRAALIHFEDHVSEEEAREALEAIAHVLKKPFRSTFGMDVAEAAELPPVTVGDFVREYDDDWGSPVWYIP